MEAKKCKITGCYYYKTLPNTAKIATKEAFYNKDGTLKINTWYLIYSYHYDLFYARKIHKNIDFSKLEPWLNDRKVFIKEVY